MKLIETGLPGCVVVEPQVFGDERGFFFESFNHDRLAAHGLAPRFVQGNVSSSVRGVLRGLHYQWPNPQGKYVSVLEGEVWDVAVDIRRGSPHFGRWTAVLLSAGNRRHFWIPEGFAHGLVALESGTAFSRSVGRWRVQAPSSGGNADRGKRVRGNPAADLEADLGTRRTVTPARAVSPLRRARA